jgi:two-component system LytT family sensor kinase
MKKKLLLLMAGFIVCYYIIHIAYDLPNLVNGYPRFEWLPVTRSLLAARIADICVTGMYVLLPYTVLYVFYPKGKTGYAIALIVVLISAVFFTEYALRSVLLKPARLRSFFNENLFFTGIYILYGIVFYFIQYAWYKELEQKDLLLQNRQSELSFLRSQINPHFLFNSLNNIYALVYGQSPRALPAIAGLSELLRYMLYNNKEKVPLEQELLYIEKYNALQKLRFEREVHCVVEVRCNPQQIQTAPLLLIPFVENAWKHGDFTQPGTGLDVAVYAAGGKLHFYCFNAKGRGEKDTGGGIGLANVRRRLELLYPGRHALNIEDSEHTFTVNLELQYGE